MDDQTSDDTGFDLDRRTLIAGAAGVGAVALAGCAEEENGDDESDEEESADNGVQRRPELPSDPGELSQPERHLVELAEYQTDLIEEIHREVTD